MVSPEIQVDNNEHQELKITDRLQVVVEVD